MVRGINTDDLWPEAYELRVFAKDAEKQEHCEGSVKKNHPGVNRTEGKQNIIDWHTRVHTACKGMSANKRQKNKKEVEKETRKHQYWDAASNFPLQQVSAMEG